MATNSRQVSQNSTLIPYNTVAADLATSGKTLARWLNNPEMGLPQPIVILGKRYFTRKEIEGWKVMFFEKSRASKRVA